MTMRKSLQIICPVFNEEDVIETFYQELSSELKKLSESYEWSILFVMDKSSDRTPSILKSMSQKDPRVKALFLSSRFGHQMSLVAGIDHTDADVIVMMDSDLQHPPALIPKLLEKYEEGYEVVYTIRSMPMDNQFFKRLGSRLFYRLMNRLSEIELSSGEADFRLISKNVASVFKNDLRERNQFLRGLFRWVGFQQIGVSYQPNERMQGESKYSWSRMFRFAIDGVVSFSKKPLKYAISMGIMSSFFALFFLLWMIVEYFITSEVPSGWTTLVVLVCFFGGIQMLFMGILGQYIGAIFDEVKARPLYIVQERINFEI